MRLTIVGGSKTPSQLPVPSTVIVSPLMLRIRVSVGVSSFLMETDPVQRNTVLPVDEDPENTIEPVEVTEVASAAVSINFLTRKEITDDILIFPARSHT